MRTQTSFTFLLLLLVLPGLGWAQIPDLDGYLLKRHHADSLRKAGQFNEAASAYADCLKDPMHFRQDGYHQAVCLAKAGQTESGAKALKAAFRDGLRYRLPDMHMQDTSLSVFKNTPHWPTIDRLADSTYAKYAAKADTTITDLVIELRDTLLKVTVAQMVLERDTANNPEKRAQYAEFSAQAEVRLALVERSIDSMYNIGKPPHINIADAKGYVAYKDMLFFMPTPWLMRKLPTLWQAVRMGNFLPDHYAVLEDVVAQRMNVPQRFGTQVVPHPDQPGAVVYHRLRLPEHVDALRATVKLPSVQAQTTNLVLNRRMKVWLSEKHQTKFIYD